MQPGFMLVRVEHLSPVLPATAKSISCSLSRSLLCVEVDGVRCFPKCAMFCTVRMDCRKGAP